MVPHTSSREYDHRVEQLELRLLLHDYTKLEQFYFNYESTTEPFH